MATRPVSQRERVDDPRLELVRALFKAYGRRDLRALLAGAHPEIELYPGVLGGLEGTVYRGPEGVRQFIEAVDAFWADFVVEPHEVRCAGTSVLVLGRAVARGRYGLEVQAQVGYLLEIHGRLIRRFQSFASADDAVSAFERTTGVGHGGNAGGRHRPKSASTPAHVLRADPRGLPRR